MTARKTLGLLAFLRLCYRAYWGDAAAAMDVIRHLNPIADRLRRREVRAR